MRRINHLFLFAVSALLADTRGEDLWISYAGKDGAGKGKKIVLISGDEEYRSEEALPMLGKILSQRHGFDCTVLFSFDEAKGFIDPYKGNSLPGMKALEGADLAIIFTRFRTPPQEEMKYLEAFLDAGKPVIGLRTSTHGFRGKWGYFGMQILGERWDGHHGGHKREGCRGVIEEANKDHAVLRGVKDVFAPSDVYGARHVTEKDTILLRGAVTKTLDPKSEKVAGKKNDPMMPLAWLHPYQSKGGGKGTAFTTTMGAAVDLVSEDARRIIVNAALFLTGLEVPAKANVDLVDPYYPSFYGFWRKPKNGEWIWAKRNLRPSDFALGKSPAAVDPPGTPKWPFREMGPKENK
ncbi:MAG: ThuA domain-containing protein [Planctomycetota bacterium]|nr:ThuA domain-containing protein [Planctomycetota bacterium]MDP7251213.1 ThuA domain-containing protein [Planctomycetota bacterium]